MKCKKILEGKSSTTKDELVSTKKNTSVVVKLKCFSFSFSVSKVSQYRLRKILSNFEVEINNSQLCPSVLDKTCCAVISFWCI